MPPTASSGWDDDDDVPLASIVKPTPATPAPQPTPAKSQKPKDDNNKKKKDEDKELRQRKPVQKSSVDLKEILKPVRGPPPPKKQSLSEYAQKHKMAIVVGTAVLLIVYGAIVSDGTNFHTDESADRIDPYKALGLPRTASDKEIKSTYRKLSMELHPDKNPDQSDDDATRFKQITQGYKILSDPEKKRKWLNHENPDDKGIPSDTLTLTDQTASEINKGAWLLLAYADWSSESWELAETWEKVGKDLGRYVNVARFNYEKSPGLAKKFSTFSVPMIYSYVNGVRTPFLGSEPSHANITLFLTKSMTDTVEVIRDATGGMFLDNQDHRVKAMLFAQQGMVKLRLAFRSMAYQFKDTMDLAEVTYREADQLRTLFNVDQEPAIVFVKEKGTTPLKYTGKMTQAKLQSLFQQHQHHWTPRLSEHNYRALCGAGALGKQPCVVYLTSGSPPPTSVLEALRNASKLDLDAMAASPVDRAPTSFGWIDLSSHPGVARALGGNKATLIALDALTKTYAAYDGTFKASDLMEWAETFRGRLESDMDPLAGPLMFSRESRPRMSWRQSLRVVTPYLMTLIALVAAWLLWYALHNLWADLRMSGKREKLKKIIDKGRAKVLEGETRKLTKWEQLEKQNQDARERKRLADEEKEARRIALEKEAAAAAARDSEAAKARAAEDAKRAAAEARKASQAPAQKPQAKKPAQVSDDELKRAIRAIVAGADLSTTTKAGIRQALQNKFPDLDLLARKELVMTEIAEAVAARVK